MGHLRAGACVGLGCFLLESPQDVEDLTAWLAHCPRWMGCPLALSRVSVRNPAAPPFLLTAHPLQPLPPESPLCACGSASMGLRARLLGPGQGVSRAGNGPGGPCEWKVVRAESGTAAGAAAGSARSHALILTAVSPTDTPTLANTVETHTH